MANDAQAALDSVVLTSEIEEVEKCFQEPVRISSGKHRIFYRQATLSRIEEIYLKAGNDPREVITSLKSLYVPVVLCLC